MHTLAWVYQAHQGLLQQSVAWAHITCSWQDGYVAKYSRGPTLYTRYHLPVRLSWPTAAREIRYASPRVGPSTTQRDSLRDCRVGPHNLQPEKWLCCIVIAWAHNVYVLLPADPLELAHRSSLDPVCKPSRGPITYMRCHLPICLSWPTAAH